MNRYLLRTLLLLALVAAAPLQALPPSPVPSEVTIQGTLSDSNGSALVGERAWSVQYYDAESGGSALGAALTGTTTVSGSGMFSLTITPPPAVFAAAEVWYALGIDSAGTPDGTVDAADEFPGRVRVTSVLFALRAADAEQLAGVAAAEYTLDSELSAALADYATSATVSNALATKAALNHTHNLQNLAGAVTDAQVPNNITITELDTLATIAARGASTTQTITVGTLNTGQGANELYAMNQPLRTSDDVSFNNAAVTRLNSANAYATLLQVGPQGGDAADVQQTLSDLSNGFNGTTGIWQSFTAGATG